MTVAVLPTRKDEAWRYSDLKAVERAHARIRLPEKSDRLVLQPGVTRLDCSVGNGAQLRTAQITVPEGTSATLVERWTGQGWFERCAEIEIGQNAELNHIILQQRDAGSETTADIFVRGTYRGFLLNLGSHFSRVAVTAEAADTQFAAVQLGQGDQTLEIVTRFNHFQAHGQSRQIVRSVMAGQATGNFLGKIYVSPDAQKIDAVQSSKALLLSRTAKVNTKPELEIHADDVKCAHGATVGELDRQALFYCQARGIPLPEARALLTEAFVADTIATIADGDVRAEVELLAADWLQMAVRHA